MGDGRRPLGDRLLQLEGLRPARQPDLDEDAAGDAVGLVVGEPVGSRPSSGTGATASSA